MFGVILPPSNEVTESSMTISQKSTFGSQSCPETQQSDVKRTSTSGPRTLSRHPPVSVGRAVVGGDTASLSDSRRVRRTRLSRPSQQNRPLLTTQLEAAARREPRTGDGGGLTTHFQGSLSRSVRSTVRSPSIPTVVGRQTVVPPGGFLSSLFGEGFNDHPSPGFCFFCC